MAADKRLISAQLRVGDSEMASQNTRTVLAKIDAAQKLAGVTRILFLPSHNDAINSSVIRHCRENGLEIYLWYKVLTDNDIVPDDGEMTRNAFGKTGAGESGFWGEMYNTDEFYRFACPRNEKYTSLLLNKCGQLVANYDGLFVDCIGFPIPSLGLESVFACFCPVCMNLEPRLAGWRRGVLELRENIESFSDADFERVGTFRGLLGEFGLMDLFSYRMECISALVGRFSTLAQNMGKDFGIDVLSPALSFLGGHDYADCGAVADWIKPRIYCHTYGPSSIPLEFHCTALGLRKWAKRAGTPAIMSLISRSTEIPMPTNLHNLTHTYFKPEHVESQIAKALAAPITAEVHPGIECSIHPDFATELDEPMVRTSLQASARAAGIVLSWNLLFIPNRFLELVRET